jgi:WD40 repeat protein
MRIFLLFSAAMIAALLGHLGISQAQENNQLPTLCNSPDYQAQVLPRDDINNRRLVLVNWNTGDELKVLEENFPYEYDYRWSPNCRYLTGSWNPGRTEAVFHRISDAPPGFIIWDTVSGARVAAKTPGQFYDYLTDRTYSPHIFWKPDSSMVAVTFWDDAWDAQGGAYGPADLWNLATGQDLSLRSVNDWSDNELYPRWTTFFQVYWDDARDWLWVSALEGVVAFSLQTGADSAFFPNPPWGGSYYGVMDAPPSCFVFSPDGTKVVVYTVAEHGSSRAAVVTIWDIATMTSTAVPTGDIAAPYITSGDASPVALSPDNHFLAVGYDAIRVWDLTALASAYEDREPTYRHTGPDALISSLRFVDNTTFETIDIDGVRQRWDVTTGIYIPN